MARRPEWSDSELERKRQAEAGQTVLANQHTDHALIAWARKQGRYVPIDRRSVLGNPVKLGEDMKPPRPEPTRAEVIGWYREHQLPLIKDRIDRSALRGGKVLGCWCYPEPCHGGVILEWLEDEGG